MKLSAGGVNRPSGGKGRRYFFLFASTPRIQAAAFTSFISLAKSGFYIKSLTKELT